MQFTVSQSDFLETFSRVSPAVPSKSTLPILSNVLLKLEGDLLQLIATDLELSVLTEIKVSGIKDGSIAVPAKKVGDIIRELEGMELDFFLDENMHMQIKAGEGEYHVPGISAQDFPSLPEFTGASNFSIEAKRLKSSITRTIFAVSKDELRPALTGVFFEIMPQELKFVTTDGHRLVRIIDQKFEYDGEPQELIVPVKALDMIQRNLPEEGDIVFSIGSNQIMLKLDNITIYSRLIEGKYPHYESVIPKDNDSHLIVSTELFTKMIRRAQIFANPISHQIVLNISSNSIEISAEDIELGGRGSEKISASFNGDDRVVGYNATYVLELMKQIDTDELRIEFGAEKKAGIVRPIEQKENEDFMMLIMPVRLN
ncbi:MAG: DNA polymerase III subunit beta [Candidatus Electryonea clarkiae]|nr:DNA polymerase III subunit beta [Candidatus Electryonea clarkiae]MDP8288970.1 DNA polymerase III subunit beta [Candidatus Electryonea clarkiae]